MKLFRFGPPGQEKPGVLLADGRRVDVSGVVQDFDARFFSNGQMGKLRGIVRESDDLLPAVPSDARLGPPVCNPSKILCVGMNYASHAREFQNRPPPAEPVLFMKAPSALCGPNDDLIIPAGARKLDYEVELAVVIGKTARDVALDAALDHVAGLTLINDVSERAWQKDHDAQWMKGKSHDGFAPLGPCIATLDEIKDIQALTLWLDVNGEPRQRGTTADMIFTVPFIISYASRFLTLLPGDIIATGTPSGVAMGMNPPRWLEPGDLIEMGIDGIGCSKRKVLGR
jgi:2-keto-4-pentenoate hydratase/2-oxohepta-3-ene-1,7-dioic acid hydratase in catechol pathway